METSRLKPDPFAPYPQMYVVLFKGITGALQLMEAGEFMLARTMLVKAQQDAEELYIDADTPQLPPPTQAPIVDPTSVQDLDTGATERKQGAPRAKDEAPAIGAAELRKPP